MQKLHFHTSLKRYNRYIAKKRSACLLLSNFSYETDMAESVASKCMMWMIDECWFCLVHKTELPHTEMMAVNCMLLQFTSSDVSFSSTQRYFLLLVCWARMRHVGFCHQGNRILFDISFSSSPLDKFVPVTYTTVAFNVLVKVVRQHPAV